MRCTSRLLRFICFYFDNTKVDRDDRTTPKLLIFKRMNDEIFA